MTTRTTIAMFSDRARAERAGQKLISELNLDQAIRSRLTGNRDAP